MMTEENKKRVRVQIDRDNNIASYGYEWHVIDGELGESVSTSVWNKDVELIYVDMDNQPNICIANYDPEIRRFIGVSSWLKGNRMMSVIAYRRIKEIKND